MFEETVVATIMLLASFDDSSGSENGVEATKDARFDVDGIGSRP